MFFKKKKPFVRFVNLIPGVEISHPVIRSQDYHHEWLRKAAVDYKEFLKNSDPAEYSFGSVNRCPGVGNLFKTGFLITAPVDFVIETSASDPYHFKWQCPMDLHQAGLPSDYIGSHSYDQLAKFMPLRNDTLKCLVKVQTGWRISCSSDIVFLQLPIAYPDHNLFTAAHGIIDCNHQVEINLQLFWHNLNGKSLVKAGTPLCHLIPVPRELAVDLIVEPATDQDRYKFKAWNYLSQKEFRRDIKSFFENSKKLLSIKDKE